MRFILVAILASASLALPACGGGGGGGGTGGSGADPCGPCQKADACCKAYQTETGGDPTQCTFASACQSVSGSTRSQLLTECQTFTTQTAAGVPSPTECR